jgi:hypothetical protein
MRALHQAVRQIRHHVGTAYATARHYAQRLDHGVNLASRIFAAARPILKDIAPAYEQKAAKGAAQAKGSCDQMRGDVVDLHSRGQAHAKKLSDISSMLGL